MDFALYEPLANVSYLAELLIWLLTLMIWIYPPQLWSVALESWRQENAEASAVYISRFLPLGLFRFMVYLLGSLAGGLLILRLGGSYGLHIASDYAGLGLQLLLFSAAVYLYLYLRSTTFKLWRYILWEGSAGALLSQDYFFQDWLRALLLALLSLLSFADLPANLLLGLSLGGLSLLQLGGILQVMLRTREASAGYLYLFLYLCAHEVVPILYVITLGTYLMRSTLLPNL